MVLLFESAKNKSRSSFTEKSFLKPSEKLLYPGFKLLATISSLGRSLSPGFALVIIQNAV